MRSLEMGWRALTTCPRTGARESFARLAAKLAMTAGIIFLPALAAHILGEML